MIQVKIGEIQGHDVLYLPERNAVFCKNTVLPLDKVKEVLKSPLDRYYISEKNMVVLLSDFEVEFGCLRTTRENINTLFKQIKFYNHAK